MLLVDLPQAAFVSFSNLALRGPVFTTLSLAPGAGKSQLGMRLHRTEVPVEVTVTPQFEPGAMWDFPVRLTGGGPDMKRKEYAEEQIISTLVLTVSNLVLIGSTSVLVAICSLHRLQVSAIVTCGATGGDDGIGDGFRLGAGHAGFFQFVRRGPICVISGEISRESSYAQNSCHWNYQKGPPPFDYDR